MLGRIVHLPDVELIGIDVGELILLLLLDCFLQVTDSFRERNVNRKGFRIGESEDEAVERDFGGHGVSVRSYPAGSENIQLCCVHVRPC